MGMSSSQARLLSLTARQHNVEYRAQKLQAEKLQMANDSDRVYNTYLTALNATKIQARIFDNSGSDTFKDATLSMLVDGMIPADSQFYDKDKTYAATSMFLKDTATGKLIVTKAYADANGIKENDNFTGSLEDWLIQKNAPTKPEDYIKDYETVRDLDTVTAFTAVGNSSFSKFSYNYTYSPVENSTDPTFDEEELAPYAEFNNSHNTVTGTAVSDITSFTAGQTYTISNANDLNKLLELSATQSTAGVNFVMTGDVNMKNVTNWSGIKNFKGTFDGNGYKISNLTGSQGLFDSATGANIKNLELENLNINNTANQKNVGGLVGEAFDSNLTNIKLTGGTVKSNGNYTGAVAGHFKNQGGAATIVSNIASSVNVTGTENTGGIMGHYEVSFNDDRSSSAPHSNPTFNNVYSVGNVTGTSNVGGIAGYWYSDPDKGNSKYGSNSYVTDVNKVYTGGTVTGNSSVGGFVGTLQCYDDYEDTFTFTNINTTAKINASSSSAGVFIGTNDAKTATTDAKFIDSGYGAGINPGMSMVGQTKTGSATIPETGGGVESFQVAGKTPSISGLTSNLVAAMIKAGEYDPYTDTDGSQKAEIEQKVANFLNQFQDSNTDNKKLFYLNNKLVSYLKGNNDDTFARLLVKDIQDGTTSNTGAYQTDGTMSSGKIKRQTEDQSWDATFNGSNGNLTVASKETIEANLKAAAKMAGSSITDADIEAFLKLYKTDNKQDLAALGRVNDILVEYSKTKKTNTNLQNLFNNIKTKTKSTEINPEIDNLDNYNVNYDSQDRSKDVKVTYAEKQNPIHGTRNVIDYDNTTTQQLIKDYYAQLGGYIIIGDTPDEAGLCDSTEWLTNMINNARATLVTMEYNAVTKEATQREVSVADETSLQEVANTENVKKAEATYEKDMKKINKKETKIDTELQQCEAERSSIKTEQDSLKSVIKDNVDLTFKLFS